MTTPSQKLAAAKARPRKFIDVDVLLDVGVADARDELQRELDEALAADALDPRLSGPNPAIAKLQKAIAKVLENAADSIATIRVHALPGDVWADIEARSPIRPGAPGDARFGYNTQSAAMKALPLCAGWLVDGEVIPLIVTPAEPGEGHASEDPAVDEWADLFATISGTEAATLESAVWELNVANPQVAIADIKKALATRPA